MFCVCGDVGGIACVRGRGGGGVVGRRGGRGVGGVLCVCSVRASFCVAISLRNSVCVSFFLDLQRIRGTGKESATDGSRQKNEDWEQSPARN